MRLTRSKHILPHGLVLAAIVTAAATVMTVLDTRDLSLTRLISAHRQEWFVTLMGDSIFELEQPGGGDLVVFFLIASVLLYVASCLLDTRCEHWPILSRIKLFLLAFFHAGDLDLGSGQGKLMVEDHFKFLGASVFNPVAGRQSLKMSHLSAAIL